jgi:hypothetical protein
VIGAVNRYMRDPNRDRSVPTLLIIDESAMHPRWRAWPAWPATSARSPANMALA